MGQIGRQKLTNHEGARPLVLRLRHNPNVTGQRRCLRKLQQQQVTRNVVR